MIHILDHRTDEIVDTIDNKERGKKYWDDVHEIKITGEDTFNFSTDYNDSEFIKSRYRVVIPDEDSGFFREYLIQQIKKYGDKLEVKCVGSFTDLKTQGLFAPQELELYTAKMAGNFALSQTEWQLGRVEVSSETERSTTVKAEDTPYSLINRMGSYFDVELNYRLEIKGPYIVGRFVDMLKSRGNWEGKEIVAGKDLIGVERNEVGEICTAVRCIGPQAEEGPPLYVEVKDEDARQRWGRYNPFTGKVEHIWHTHTPETEEDELSEARLQTLGELYLSKHINAIVEYTANTISLEEVFGFEHEKVRLGDWVRVKDTSYTPALYLEARVISITRSLSNPANKQYKLGDFVEYDEEDLNKIIKNLKHKIATRDRSKITRSRIVELQKEQARAEFFNEQEKYNEISTNTDLSQAKKDELDQSFTDYQNSYTTYQTNAQAIVDKGEASEEETQAVMSEYTTVYTNRQAFTQKVEQSVNDYTQGKTDSLQNKVAQGKVPIKFGEEQHNILENSDSSFYIDDSGAMIFTDPNNPNLVMKLTSTGLGISTTGLSGTFQTVMTAQGLNIAAVYTGLLSADYIRGGSLDIGGMVNGVLRVLDEEGIAFAEISKDRVVLNKAHIGHLSGDNVVTTNNDNIDYYVNETGDDENLGTTSGLPFRNMDKVWDMIPGVNNGDIFIRVKSRLVEPINIPSFMGSGKITIDFQSNELVGKVNVSSGTNDIVVQNGTINQPDETSGASVEVYKCAVQVKDLVIYTNNKDMWSVLGYGNSSVDCVNVEVHGATRAGFGCRNKSQMTVTDCSGYAPLFGVDAYRAIIYINGTGPNGGTSPTNEYQGGRVFGAFDSTSGGDVSNPTPSEKTKTFKANDAGAWRPNFGGQWNKDQPLQGKYGSYGEYRGAWFFGNLGMSGKSISRIRVKVERDSQGGKAQEVPIRIRTHNYTSQPSGKPTFSSEYEKIDLAWEDNAKWVELPSNMYNQFESGNAQGIGVYYDGGGYDQYAYMTKNATIEITYS